jgi:pyrroloquinoline quinone (PQQ) biosynthesis protein C
MKEERMKHDIVFEMDHAVHRLANRLQDHPIVGKVLDGTANRRAYVTFLKATYQYVCWTKPLLVQGARALDLAGRHPQLAELYRSKAEEEQGHEHWALHDLAELGASAGAVVRARPCAAVTAYVNWNRHHVTSGRPLSLFGTAYALEKLSAEGAPRAVEELRARSSIPSIDRALTFLQGHAAADHEHIAELGSRLRSITDRDDQKAIILSAQVTCYLYEGFFGSDAYLEDLSVRSIDRLHGAGNAGRRTRRPPRGTLEGVAGDRALHVNTE